MMRETGRQGMPIDVRPQMLYNPAMRAPNFFVPGVIGVVLQIGTTVAAAMALVREREPIEPRGSDAWEAGSIFVHRHDHGSSLVHDYAVRVFCAY